MITGKPVVLGSSFTGLLISRSLSQAGIEHLLVGGDEPEEKPRLGESVHELAAIELWRWLGPELHEHFHAKNHLCLLNGRVVSYIYTRDPNEPLKRVVFSDTKADMMTQTRCLITVDRTRLDPLLYRQVTADPTCRFVRDPEARPVHDEHTDAISAIRLSHGETIAEPAYVFDATGPAAVVARAAGVKKETLGKPERLVWTHRCRRGATSEPPRVWWRYGTTSLKLIDSVDAVAGPAWLIPLPDRISLGLSVDPARYSPERIDDQDLIRLLDEAFARRGIDYLDIYPEVEPIQAMTYRHFIRERAHGANWLLAGLASVQTWFPAQLGLVASTLAARLAPRLLTAPEENGRLYDQTLREQLGLHDHFDRMISGPPFEHVSQAHEFWRRLGVVNLEVQTNGLRIVNDDLGRVDWHHRMASALHRLAQSECLSPLTFKIADLLGAYSIRAFKPPTLRQQGEALKDYFTAASPIFRDFHKHEERWRTLGAFLTRKRSDPRKAEP